MEMISPIVASSLLRVLSEHVLIAYVDILAIRQGIQILIL